MRSVLVNAPFAPVDRPPLGLALLAAGAKRAGMHCEVAHLNIQYAQALGPADYARLASGLPAPALAGEWVFAGTLYGRDREGDGAYVDEVLLDGWRLDHDDVELVRASRAKAENALAAMFAAVDWAAYDVVGFSSNCAQNLAALALARRVKQATPSTFIVFGGCNWRGAMGRALLAQFPFVDFALSGEADESFVELLRGLSSDRTWSRADIPGLIYRERGKARTIREQSPADLDLLAVPDFGDYLEARRDHALDYGPSPYLPVETSRGCWWADGEPCRFCGLDPALQPFRSKTPDRIEAELRSLASNGEWGLVDIVDNVVSPRFLNTVMRRLASRPLNAPLFFEVRPDVSRGSLRRIARAGASIQTGIESFSDGSLALMGKGVRGLENARLLRWCREEGVKVTWNLIHGFPGETADDQARSAAGSRALRALDAPVGCGPVAVYRFSRYFDDPERHGFRDLRPTRAYRHVYPFGDAALRDIAYTFDYDYAEGMTPPSPTRDLYEGLKSWQSATGSRLTIRRSGEGGQLSVLDAREADATREYVLDALDARLHEACASISDLDQLVTGAQTSLPHGADGRAIVRRRLARFVRRGLMLTDGRRFLSLATPDSEAAQPRD